MTDRWAVARRFDLIDYLLATRGEVNRGDLVAMFGVSLSQASEDIRQFLELYPEAMRYDKNAKRYYRGPSWHKFKRRPQIVNWEMAE